MIVSSSALWEKNASAQHTDRVAVYFKLKYTQMLAVTRAVYPAHLDSMNLRSSSTTVCVSWRVQTGAAALLLVYIPQANGRKALGTRIDFVGAHK